MRNHKLRALLTGSIAIVLVAAVAGTGLAAGGKKAAAGDTCLVTDVGGLNDRSFNQLANKGRLDGGKALGVKTSVLQSSKESDYIPNLLSCVQSGADLTIGVGFLMAEAVNTVATRFPSSKFAIIDYRFQDLAGKPANTRGILFREQEAGYLSGWLAIKTLMSQKKPLVIGAVGGFKIPPVDRYMAGYKAGAQAANPKAKVLLGYAQSFTDQSKCKELSLNHIAEGSQVEFGVAGSCGLGSLSAAKDKGLWGIGVDADQGYLGAHMLTSAVKRVDVGVSRTMKQAKTGTFKGFGNTIFSVRSGGIGLGKVSPKVPKAIIAAEKVLENKIRTGKVKGIPTEVK
ncbi:MAG: BMP family ABC transporter substrate-binding protein [Thermoleophilia bacterium]|nr:BMP family ABC transporter substrate-binding protein [Thermoleophilia bacterium]